jgi:hypothetical protein
MKSTAVARAAIMDGAANNRGVSNRVTRRTIMNMAVTGLVATSPAIANPLLEPDAELIELGRQWDAIRLQERTQRDRSVDLWNERDAAIYADLGIEWSDDGPSRRLKPHERERYLAMMEEPRFAECERVHNDLSELTGRMDALNDMILRATAGSFAGLAIQARVAAHWTDMASDEVKDGWPIVVAIRFIEAALRSAGARLPEGVPSAWINTVGAPASVGGRNVLPDGTVIS